jgi:preprotein translocase subunit YajC
MNRYRKQLIFLFILLFLGIAYYSLKNRPQSASTEKTAQELSASLSINDGTGTQGYEVSGYIGKTALEATESVAKVETNGTGINAFVTSINNRKADAKKHEFWELDANGAETQVGAGSYIIQNGDKIEWKVSTY